ncbi:acetyl-CoA synthetase-like protein [Pleomassaria siparia CBS 279.74]|uniref:Acetyl-CoA synthetase-like protein n=1 Tax=Pleomassaria siparia CBS 279.74 TaxID=1314801 RepID=A0A6G1KAX0_9PLEO|nr:acetyl-CoA synthetase-like protein [Pleomassaria siparia CBS 279.74]
MPFLAQTHVQIPTKDILSWTYDTPLFDQHKAIYIDAADETQSITAAQARLFTRQLIAGFKKAGLNKGDVVLIHSFNNIWYPVIVLGIVGFGGIFTGTNPSYTPAELKHAIDASKVKLIISEPELLSSINTLVETNSFSPSKILVLDSPNQANSSGFPSWRTLLTHGEQDWLRFDSLRTSKDTTALLLFSSGTTGLPKPAKLSHYNLIAQHTLVYEVRPLPYDLSRLVHLPMFHASTAPSTHISALRAGHTQYIMPRFSIANYLNYLEKHKITDITLVPPVVTTLVSSPLPLSTKQKCLRFVKRGIASAAPLDKDMQARFKALLSPDATFNQFWAMSETACIACEVPYPENDITGSVGTFLPNLDVKLLHDEGHDITAYGVRGELAIRGPTVTEGYLGVPRERDFDAEGYFITGDIMYCDPETKLWYVVDRKKELIKVRGFQVAPAELEGVLLRHPGIRDAAVIGIMSVDGDSELPRAYVVRKEGSEGLQEKDVKAWMEGKLAKYKRLEGGVRFVQEIPKTASGKILKRTLREMAKRDMGAKL